jgi:hypothetical protein
MPTGFRMPTEHRSTAWVWMIPLLLFATWLGGRSLNTYLPWVDEMISLEASGSVPYGPISPGDIVNRVNASCCWPPGHDFLLAGWNSIAGHGVFTGRTLSLLIGPYGQKTTSVAEESSVFITKITVTHINCYLSAVEGVSGC